ncbi:hypothetical protein CSA56_10980 [candidate division KSB3 bacterium]|uniref:Alpha-2-macroglobulin n=1 Tax=candidate division KSB3 bacterium TaxID=2044937 RepID=A0A2G6KD92_9BACT|nr:MAG: hypothetical protein CSA56_10980 [candidate division KSB3 bacterium]
MKKYIGLFLITLVLFSHHSWASEAPVEEEKKLQIISATPQGELNSLDDASAITITFNDPVVSLSGVEKDFREGPLTISPEVSGVYRWMGTSTLSFIPDEKLDYATRYIVQVNAPMTAINGEMMEENMNFSFVTPRPQIQRTFPGQEEGQITLKPAIFLKFDQPIDVEKAVQFMTLSSKDGDKVPLAISYPTQADVDERRLYWLRKDDKTMLKILPQQPLQIETQYILKIKAGLPGKGGRLGMKDSYELLFYTYNRFRAEGIEPGSDYCGEPYYPEYGIRVFFSNPVNFEKLLEHIRFVPEVSWSQESSYESRELTISPHFEPNTDYSVVIDTGLTDRYGNTLEKEASFTFRTTDYAPYLTMPSGRMISESYLGTRFPVKMMNVFNAPFEMKAYRTPEDILKAVKTMTWYDFAVEDPDVSRDYRPDLIRNKTAMMPFDLSEVLHEGEETGIIGLKMGFQTCNGEERDYRSLIFLTEMSVTAKFSSINNLFWVTKLQDSSPVEGAEIELYDANQRFLWKGVTDADGFLVSPGWKGLGMKVTDSWDSPWVFAIVRSGDDRVVIHSRDGTGIWPYRFGINYSENSENLTNDGYIFTERGIYRPGEEVRIVGIVRDKEGMEFMVPEYGDVEVTVTDPDSKELLKQMIPLTDFGSFHLPLQLADNAKLGTYWIECHFPIPGYMDLPDEELEWIGNSISGSFKVEMYRPVEFEVDIDLPQTEYIKGDTVNADINATYLFGGPVRDVPLEWNLSRTAYWFSPEAPDFKGYSFNTSERQGAGHVAEKNGELDRNGNYLFKYAMTDEESGSFSYSLDATVTDINKRRVSKRQSLIVHGGEYYIGLKPASFFANTEEDFVITTVALTPDEKPLPGQEYQVQIKRIWWESVRRTGNGGRLYWESEKKEKIVQEYSISSEEKPVEIAIALDKVGYYQIEASGTDSRGNTITADEYFYAVGSGYAAWKRDDDDYVEIVPDAKTYQPGDTASILVKSPYENVKALVTIEREGILERWVETIEGSADTIEIPIKSEYIPNVYIGVVLIQERIAYNKIKDELDLGKPSFKIGYAGIQVNPAERRLQVELSTDKEEYRPGNEVELQLQVTDKDGNGQEAEVIVSVVDVGVLNLIGYATPDPFDYFYRVRPLSVLTSELRNSIVGQRNYSEKGERASGGGLDAAAMMKLIELREKFKPTAYHNSEILTDTDGRATVKFTLPDNLTSFRIMATAHTSNSFFGAGDKRIKVNKKLMLTSSLPAFLRIGDTVQAGVLAHNRTTHDGEALVQAEVKGVTLASQDMQEVALSKGDTSEVLFSYMAEEEREATFIFRGKLEDETDGLKVNLPVLLHRLPLTTALFGSTTEESHREFIEVPKDAESGWGSVDFSLASTMFTDIKGGVEFLFDYPYGCLEQRISKILPMILAEDLISAFDLEVLKSADYKKIVQKTLNDFSNYQHDGGGFGYWEKPYWPSAFVSAYAVFTMAMAKQEGYTVDEEVEQKAVTYLENVLKGQNERQTVYRYNRLAWNVTDAFILYALTLYDKYQPAYATRLYEVRDRLPVFGKSLLLRAVHKAKGDEIILQTLKEELMNSARVEARTAYFDENNSDGLAWIHYSNVRSTAAVAQALMEVYGADQENKSFIPKTIQWLLRQRKQKLYWRTTQENLFAFWALSTYLKVFEGQVPDFTGKVLIAGKETLAELFQGRTTTIAEKSVALDEFDKDDKTAIDFVKEGDGRMYYSAALTYLPSGIPEPIDYGIALQKTMTVVKGKGEGTDNFYRGDIIKIEVTLTTPRDRLFVFVDDPLPAGFKALNFGLKTTDQSLREFIENDTPFRYSEYKDDRVVFYADYIEQGVYTVSYLVSAEHSGSFNLPPTFASEMYTPEVFGQSSVDVIEIK